MYREEKDTRCRAAIVGNSVNAIIPIKRPSDNVVQTAPLKCRYTKSGICANVAGFCLCRQANFALPSSHDARTRKSSCTTRLTGSPVNWPR